jgi:hypothetical protein
VDDKAAAASKPVETTLPTGGASNKYTAARASHILVDGEALCKEVWTRQDTLKYPAPHAILADHAHYIRRAD